MQGMKNGTECTLSRENETLPGAKPDSERNRYDPCTAERRRRPRRPPKRAGREKGGAKNTDLPFRRSAWYIYMVVQDSRTRRARPLQLCPTQCNSPGSRRGGADIPPRLQPTFSWAYPQWRTFVPAAYAASVHPCAHSTGRAGFGYPFPSMPTPGPWWAVRPPATLDQQTFIYLSATLYYRNWPLSTLLPTPAPRPGSSLR